MTPDMISFRLFSLSFVVFLALCLNTTSVYAQFDDSHIRAVDASAASCGDGATWNTAYQFLQDALDYAATHSEIDQIWVKAGEYFVDQSCANEVGSGGRDETFQLVKGVFLLGGFDGMESFAFERDAVANPTILSGMVDDGVRAEGCPAVPGLECGTGGSCFQPNPGIPACDNSRCCQLVCASDPLCCCEEWIQVCVDIALDLCGEAYHVVTAGSEIDDPEQTMIDGFTIGDGWANGETSLDRDHGGGMLIKGEPSVVRCTIRQNTASTRGGGMSMSG